MNLFCTSTNGGGGATKLAVVSQHTSAAAARCQGCAVDNDDTSVCH